MKVISKISIILLVCFSYSSAVAQDFVYKPINPAFGGDTFNYNWLLSSATSQNNTTDPDQEDRVSPLGNNSTNSLDNFTESLNRQLLNQLSRSLLSSQFGSEGLEEGNYSIGNFDISVIDIGEGLSITIFDSSTGSETQIIVPYF
ncbi:MAG: curli production assembly/transport component CsgF [Saprospiraceae bacterium]